jgi:glucosamine--fructose-6-phosphate aminotransferase (isomerizing)
MHTHSEVTFHRQLSPFGLLNAPQAQLSPGPNAKPGSRPRVAVLHHGDIHIHIHNHTALRNQLQDRGYHFGTDNDGELIAHLIDAVHPGDALQAVRRAAALLQGLVAFAVQFHDQTHRLLATRMGPPVALRLHPERVELLVPAFLASNSLGKPTGLYLLTEGDILDIDTNL